jgi:WXG100 family type VII secretion target
VSDAFRVDPEALADAVARMSAFEQHVESMLAEVDTLVANLHAEWSGEAAAAHTEAHRRWTEGAKTMREALGRLRNAGDRAHHNYTGAIAANASMWS